MTRQKSCSIAAREFSITRRGGLQAGLKAPGGESSHQKEKRKANWICLDVVEVLEILPIDGFMRPGAPLKTEAPEPLGPLKAVWFNGLKISIRNCKRRSPPKANSLCRETSVLNTFGAVIVLRPALPRVPNSGKA